MRDSIGEMFRRAMKCENREQADAWMQAEVKEFETLYGYTTEKASEIIRGNLGYMSGYYGYPEAQKVFALFDAVHPVFGKPDDWPKDPREIFNRGVEIGKLLQQLHQGSRAELVTLHFPAQLKEKAGGKCQ